ncbi:MAG TPA: hypothetical protein VHO03_17005 [Ignavibacteriales bacterium]|nr:hypothetical protein [Ignavibacteriales bacterium]
MRNKAYLPRLPYVVFELIKIDLEEQKLKGEDNYKAEQIDTIYLAVMPQNYSFKKRGRNALTQTGEDVFTDRYPNSPERVSISGTFGDMPRLIGGTFLDGYTRLKQFEERIIDMKLEGYALKEEIIQKEVEASRALLTVNYYDFMWHKFGSISLGDFDVRSNAAENTQLIRYSFDFTITGPLYKVKADLMDGDPLLQGLKTVLGPGAQSKMDETVNSLLYLAAGGTKFLGALDALGFVNNLVQDIKDTVNSYTLGANKEYDRLRGELKSLQNGYNSLKSEIKNLG